MSSNLVSVLHLEERSIVAELRASKPFQRLEAIRRLLALYDTQPSVATGLDVPGSAEPDRMSGEVIHLANAVSAAAAAPPANPAPMPNPTPMAATPAPQVSAISLAAPVAAPVANTITLGGPALAPAPQVAAVAEAAVANVVVRAPSYGSSSESETSSVVSSVRAALMGFGKS